MANASVRPPTGGALNQFTPDVMRMARDAAVACATPGVCGGPTGAKAAAKGAGEGGPKPPPNATTPAVDPDAGTVKAGAAAPADAALSTTTDIPTLPPSVAGLTPDVNAVTGVPHGIPPTAPAFQGLTEVPKPGSVLAINKTGGVGEAINRLFHAPSADDPTGSSWTNINDMRVVLPIMHRESGAIATTIETLPGRDMTWATIQVGKNNADAKLNFDGVQGAVRLGIAGPMMNTTTVHETPMMAGPGVNSVQWAEFKVGAEGLVFTGRVADGKFSVTGMDLQEGFFKVKADGLQDWATHHLAIVIPVGIAGAVGAVFVASEIAKKTGQDLPVPIGVTVLNKNGFTIKPIVRPIMGATQFVKFGGAEVNFGYTLPNKINLNIMPGYNNDLTQGAIGPTVASRVNIGLPYGAVAGAEVRYNPASGVSAFIGVGLTF